MAGDWNPWLGLGRERGILPILSPEAQVKLLNAFRLHGQLAPDEQALDAGFAAALRRVAGREWADDLASRQLRAICLLVADLCEQGWRARFEWDPAAYAAASDHLDAGDTAEPVQIVARHIRLVFEPPERRVVGESVEETKARLRRSLQLGRDRQLREPAVRRFIGQIERPPRASSRRSSVLDLIDDGPTLAGALGKIRTIADARQEAELRRLIQPVVEVCDAGARCATTGIKLIDVWRYFRHTWSIEYRAIPGRQLPLLVRNAARPTRPVIGIALLASPVMRLAERDKWIGWRRDAAEAKLREEAWSWSSFARALLARLDASLGEIRTDDLATAAELRTPSENTVFRLEQRAYGAAQLRERQLREFYEHGRVAGAVRSQRGAIKEAHGDADWRAASEDPLFVRKRAGGLAELLFAKMILVESGVRQNPRAALEALFGSERGQRALDIALTEFRKAGLASTVADVSVCGAVHPYTELLGGKLVALLMASREVREFYAARYGGQSSLIASQVAGRPVSRPAELGLLTTSSLYGTGSSQYNRLVLRKKDHRGLGADIWWQHLGKRWTAGYGTLHLSRETTEALRQMSEWRHGARRVNHRFGEGTSPRLRQIREGLDALGMESNHILHHATPRIVYGCELAPRAREHLVMLAPEPRHGGASVEAIARAWRRRWLGRRILRDETLCALQFLGPMSVRAALRPDGDWEEQLQLPFGL